MAHLTAQSPDAAASLQAGADEVSPAVPGQEAACAAAANIPLDRDVFMRELVRDLCGTLEQVVGLEEAQGFVSLVGQHIGEWLGEEYRKGLGAASFSHVQIAAVLVDLKRRIHGDFYVREQDDDKVVLGNRACPFGDKVKDRPSLCMMTSNVFGTIASEHTGYAKVSMLRTIAAGHPECEIVVYLRKTRATLAAPGHEYFGA